MTPTDAPHTRIAVHTGTTRPARGAPGNRTLLNPTGAIHTPTGAIHTPTGTTRPARPAPEDPIR